MTESLDPGKVKELHDYADLVLTGNNQRRVGHALLDVFLFEYPQASWLTLQELATALQKAQTYFAYSPFADLMRKTSEVLAVLLQCGVLEVVPQAMAGFTGHKVSAAALAHPELLTLPRLAVLQPVLAAAVGAADRIADLRVAVDLALPGDNYRQLWHAVLNKLARTHPWAHEIDRRDLVRELQLTKAGVRDSEWLGEILAKLVADGVLGVMKTRETRGIRSNAYYLADAVLTCEQLPVLEPLVLPAALPLASPVVKQAAAPPPAPPILPLPPELEELRLNVQKLLQPDQEVLWYLILTDLIQGGGEAVALGTGSLAQRAGLGYDCWEPAAELRRELTALKIIKQVSSASPEARQPARFVLHPAVMTRDWNAAPTEVTLGDLVAGSSAFYASLTLFTKGKRRLGWVLSRSPAYIALAKHGGLGTQAGSVLRQLLAVSEYSWEQQTLEKLLVEVQRAGLSEHDLLKISALQLDPANVY